MPVGMGDLDTGVYRCARQLWQTWDPATGAYDRAAAGWLATFVFGKMTTAELGVMLAGGPSPLSQQDVQEMVATHVQLNSLLLLGNWNRVKGRGGMSSEVRSAAAAVIQYLGLRGLDKLAAESPAMSNYASTGLDLWPDTYAHMPDKPVYYDRLTALATDARPADQPPGGEAPMDWYYLEPTDGADPFPEGEPEGGEGI